MSKVVGALWFFHLHNALHVLPDNTISSPPIHFYVMKSHLINKLAKIVWGNCMNVCKNDANRPELKLSWVVREIDHKNCISQINV